MAHLRGIRKGYVSVPAEEDMVWKTPRLNGCDTVRIPFICVILLCMTCCIAQATDADNDLIQALERGGGAEKSLTGALHTYDGDGRKSIVTLYRAQLEMKKKYGWEMEYVFTEEIELSGGRKAIFPVTCLKTARRGPALWFITGIHGEEPAGPVALARNLPAFAALGRKIPVVIFPLCNPSGYYKNWRYPNTDGFTRTIDGQSVSDSEHMLPGDSGGPRRAAPASTQCDSFTRKVIELAGDYPPVLVMDFHEDNLKGGGYVYSQGVRGADDPIARRIISEFIARDFPLCLADETEWDEVIRDGIISPVKDGSIDELLSAARIVRNGAIVEGPHARSVIVLETGSKKIPLSLRVKVQSHFIRMLEEFWTMADS